MGRLARYAPAAIPQHVIQRGNNRQSCFVSKENFAVYSAYLNEALEKYAVRCHGWVFMTNHVHLLCTPSTDNALSKMMQWLGQKYVRYYNRHSARSGTLFEGRFKSCPVQTERYFLNCLKYIELNPVRAGMVSDPAEYYWSSYQANALGKNITMWTPHPEYLRLGKTPAERRRAYREIMEKPATEALLKEIRQSTQRGMALGNDRFKDQLEQCGSRRQRPLKSGPKKSAP